LGIDHEHGTSVVTTRFSKEMAEALGAPWDSVQLVNEDLYTLEYLRNSTVAYRGSPNGSRIPWQIELYSECALHRIVVIARGCVEAWTSSNLISAFLCGRALIETVALLWDFSEQLDRLVTAGDITAVPLLIDRRMFDSKTFNDDTRSSQAVSVLTIISKFEKRVPGVRRCYDEMSEFCHPNYFGVYGAFSQLNLETLIGTISETILINRGTFSIMMKALTLLMEVTRILGKIDDCIPRFLRG
jgi:hypothetical protein